MGNYDYPQTTVRLPALRRQACAAGARNVRARQARLRCRLPALRREACAAEARNVRARQAQE
eukprot:2329535-Heterocapsa_arctica.AAC.1